MRIMVTGGAGFVGSHLCEKYVKEGHTVFCIDNFMSGDLNNIKHLPEFGNFKLVKGDIRDWGILDRVKDIDVIFNMAAQIHVDRSYVEPRLTYEINVLGTQNVLEFARFYDIKKVIHASTSEVYGSALYTPIDENHPLNSPHPYGASKIASDRMCYSYSKTYGMDIKTLRFFNAFGPRQKDVGYGGVISIFLRRILNGFPPIIFGDGEQTRDYTYIDDMIRGYDSAMIYHGKIADPINFGTGEEVSINTIAEKLISLSDKELTPVHVEPRKGEVKRLIADYTRAKELFGWEPMIDFDSGLRRFVDWYKDFGKEMF